MLIFECRNVNNEFNIFSHFSIDIMKERIIQIMEREGMTPARFADSIGVQRSIMSHILSGRNNPSLDVLLKIISRFDYLSTDWVLFGKEPIFKHQQSAKHINDEDQELPDSEIEMRILPEVEKNTTIKNEDPIPYNSETLNKKNISNNRRVSRIMVFYSDNTFENFVPELIVKNK